MLRPAEAAHVERDSVSDDGGKGAVLEARVQAELDDGRWRIEGRPRVGACWWRSRALGSIAVRHELHDRRWKTGELSPRIRDDL